MPKYKLNPGAFRREILQSDFMGAEVEYRAELIKTRAEATAPRDTDRYARSFRVRRLKRGGIHNDRVAGVVYNTDPAALSIEFGSFRRDGSRNPGHYTLTKAIDAAHGSG